MLMLTGCQSMSSLVPAEHLLTPAEESTLHMLNGLTSGRDTMCLYQFAETHVQDMICDDLLQGSIDSETLQRAMQGHWVIRQETAQFPLQKP